VGAIQNVIVNTWVGLVTNVLTCAGTLAVMVRLNPLLAAVSALILPAFAFPVARVGRRRYEIQARTQSVLAELAAHSAETLSVAGSLLVKGFGQEARELHRFSRLSRELQDLGVRQALVGRWLFAFVGALSTLGPAVLYGVGGTLVVRGELSVGSLVAFAAYLVQLYGPASNLVNVHINLTAALALFRRIAEVLDQPSDLPPPPTPRPWSGPGELSFDHVHFRYDPSRPLLSDITFSVLPGTMTALVGPSGAGKTTIMYLAARFLDPGEGRVLLDGVDLREVDPADLRRQVALVTQEPVLFHTTLRENLTYGRPEATEAEVLRALEAAELADLVQQLPQGLETVVGERGYRLSGGEKQRVALARAFLHDPRLLLLDEATSSLDTVVERRIQEALHRLLAGRTVLVIAHRLSTVLRADDIVVVAEGRIVERGRHEALLARRGLYSRLYEEQFRDHPSLGQRVRTSPGRDAP
jgi:ATP-binding cassette subfamily B protein